MQKIRESGYINAEMGMAVLLDLRIKSKKLI